MIIKHLAMTASALALLAGSAYAQAANPAASETPPAAAMPAMPSEPAAGAEAATPATGTAASAMAPAATTDASAVVSVVTVTNGPIADTPENRAKYGEPLSRAGRRTAAKGN